MKFSLSTHWNASQHSEGGRLIEEVLEMGFDQVELGYNLRSNLVPGIKRLVQQGEVEISSVHNYCPVPPAVPYGHPELFTLTSRDRTIRNSAIHHTTQTIRFAAEVGAKFVVFHCGNVEMKNLSAVLGKLYREGKRLTNSYEKTKMNLLRQREKKISTHLNYLLDGLSRLKPILKEYGVKLGLENLPSAEAIPTPKECQRILNELGSDCFCYWHDIGHGQIQQNLGFFNHLSVLKQLSPYVEGMHIHDVKGGIFDHAMPPSGEIDFSKFEEYARIDIVRVLEPKPSISAEEVKLALSYLKKQWCDQQALHFK